MAQQTEFAHLHVHTEYSLLDGSSKIKELVQYAKKLGMKHLAITDHGVMFGVVDFYKACLEEGIHPVIGCEVYVAVKSRLSKEGREDASYRHLVLLAENQTGYQNLIKLVSLGFTEGYYYKPRVDKELLAQYHEGIIALSACLAGVIARPLLDESYDAAKEEALWYRSVFGADNFFLELQDHGIADQRRVNQGLLRMSKETGIPLVATNDSHYTYPEDREAHDILLCIQTGKKVQDEDRLRYEEGYYLRSPEKMAERFPYAPEAISNTVRIAERCQVDFVFHDLKLPQYDVPDGLPADQYLRQLVEQGLKQRYPVITETVRQRVEHEMSIIESMGYVDYFLIVWDYIHFAKTHGISVGPGRGSAAGSIVAYCLNITTIDPLQYDLVFERFLNPERVSMPDIDVDFCYRRRQEVIDYVIQKYGEDRVAQIVTFGTMAARLVIRDVGRVLDMPYGDVDKVAKMIPAELGITIELALTKNPELKDLYQSDAQVRHLIDMSKRLEGLPRHCSTHAAGVVISKKPVMEYVPLNANDGNITTQFTMNTLEELGLLKMDFLGLRTLTVLNDAVDMIRETESVEIDLEHLPLDDASVYEMISAGQTSGVFQLESAGMTSFMRELKPSNIEDIIAGVALYRPGPMDFIPNYVKGKQNAESITYRTPELEPILKNTYGCIVYQEQVMQIVRDLAGYTMGRSDLVRKAMSKKKGDVMEQERKNFIYGNEAEGVKGCIANGISEEAASLIYEDMMDFAKYAFNKAHSACYAVVSYQTAWLKKHYPVEFMAALMTSVIDHSGKLIEYIQQLKSMGIELLSPDVNEGGEGFTVVTIDGVKKIRYCLSAIKSVGHGVIENMVREREARGPFTSLTDFCRRMQDRDLNKRCLENMIMAGAFDSLGGRRSQYMQMYPAILNAATQWKKIQMSGQIDLFGLDVQEDGMQNGGIADDGLPDIPEWPVQQLLAYEKEVLGLYLSGHPLAEYESVWRRSITHFASDFAYAEDEEESTAVHQMTDGLEATIGGIIMKKTIKTTRNNKLMAFLTIEDLYGTVEVLVFPNSYEQYRDQMEEDSRVFITGRISMQEDEDAKLILRELKPMQIAKAEQETKLQRPSEAPVWLRFASANSWAVLKDDVLNELELDPGIRPVRIYLEQEQRKLKAPDELSVRGSDDLALKLKRLIGEKNVVI